MVQLCTKCSRANPSEAVYCYFDGFVLGGHQRQGGPVSVGSQPFTNPFVFPTGRTCRNFDELALACQSEWKAACGLLTEGYLEGFFKGLGRVDLARAAKEASKFPDAERGLDQILEKIPSTAVSEPKLRVDPLEFNLGVLDSDKERIFTLELENTGGRLLFGTVSSSELAWISLGDAGATEKHFQFTDEAKIQVHIRPANIRASTKPIEAKIIVESNGGLIPIILKGEKPVRPFPKGALKGAKAPRQVAELAMKAPKDVAPFFEDGDVEQWYKNNGWIYPVKTPSASGLAALQQFFEALGVTKPPAIDISDRKIDIEGDPGEKIVLSIDVSTQEKKAAWAHGSSNVPWLEVSKAKCAGRTASIGMTVPSVPDKPGQVLEGELTVIGNGNKRWLVPVRLTIGGKRAARPPAGGGGAFDFGAAAPEPPPPTKKSAPDIRVEEPRQPAPYIEPPRRSRKQGSSVGHLIPALLLALAVVGVAVYDLLAKKPAVVNKEVETPLVVGTPMLDVKFSDRATWGLTIRDSDKEKGGGKQLTFTPTGRTNNTIVKINDFEYYFGFKTKANVLTPANAEKPEPMKKPRVGWTSMMEFRHLNNPIVVKQQVEIVRGAAGAMDTCLVIYSVENKGEEPIEVHLRCLLDTYIGKNDGVPFTIPGEKGFVSTQKVILGAEKIPDYIEAIERPEDPDNPGTIARIGLKGLGERLNLEDPDKLVICKFPGEKTRWDFPMVDMKTDNDKTGDSCIGIYWQNPLKLRDKQTRYMGFTYGLNKLEVGESMLGLSVPASIGLNREFVVTCYTYNTKKGQEVTLELPAGLTLATGETEKKTVDEASGRSQVFWRVKASKEGTHNVTASSGAKKSKPAKVVVNALGLFG